MNGLFILSLPLPALAHACRTHTTLLSGDVFGLPILSPCPAAAFVFCLLPLYAFSSIQNIIGVWHCLVSDACHAFVLLP